MSSDPSELHVFSILNPEKISKIINLLDENIVEDQFRSPKLQDLKKLGFTIGQARDILECFFNFYISSDKHDEMITIIDNSSLTSDAKSLAKNAYEEIIKRADKTKIDILEKTADVETFGHPHLHAFKVMSEFRSIVKNGKIERIVNSIVVEGNVQSSDHQVKTPINFQMDLSVFEKFVKSLNEDLENIRNEITILKEQLGDNIVK